jgi:hypothetical protein
MRRNLPLLHTREAAMVHFRPILACLRPTDRQWRILRAQSGSGAGLEPGQIAESRTTTFSGAAGWHRIRCCAGQWLQRCAAAFIGLLASVEFPVPLATQGCRDCPR